MTLLAREQLVERLVSERSTHARVTEAAFQCSAVELAQRMAWPDIDWLITGGESGPGHRPVKVEWLRELRDRCETEGVAFFFKQWGGSRAKAGGRLLDGRTWDEMPSRNLR